MDDGCTCTISYAIESVLNRVHRVAVVSSEPTQERLWLKHSIVLHAEMPIYEAGFVEPTGIHLWIDLPKQVRTILFIRSVTQVYEQYKTAAPSYQEFNPNEYALILISALRISSRFIGFRLHILGAPRGL